MQDKPTKLSWWRRLWRAYSRFCDEIGVNQGACRGCVPVVKFDPEPEAKSVKQNEKM